MALSAEVEHFLELLSAARGASEHTLRAYGADLGELCRHLEQHGIAEPSEITPRALRGWLAALDERGLARRSVQRKLSAARSFLKALADQGAIAVHPARALRQARTRRALPKSLETREIEALLAAPDTTTPAGRRDRALLELMYSAGTRAAETVGLDRRDLDLRRGVALAQLVASG